MTSGASRAAVGNGTPEPCSSHGDLRFSRLAREWPRPGQAGIRDTDEPLRTSTIESAEETSAWVRGGFRRSSASPVACTGVDQQRFGNGPTGRRPTSRARREPAKSGMWKEIRVFGRACRGGPGGDAMGRFGAFDRAASHRALDAQRAGRGLSRTAVAALSWTSTPTSTTAAPATTCSRQPSGSSGGRAIRRRSSCVLRVVSLGMAIETGIETATTKRRAARESCPAFRLLLRRRIQDSNLRGREPNTLSKRAP